MDMRTRSAVLADLLHLRLPLKDIQAELQKLEWDVSEERIELVPRNVVAVLERFLDSTLSREDVEMWADLIEVRDDILLQPQTETLLKEFLFELANPSINPVLDAQSAGLWIDRLSKG